MDNKLRETLVDYMNFLGILYGFTECRKFIELYDYLKFKSENGDLTEFENRDIDSRINPFLYLENGETIISIAIPYYREYSTYNQKFSKYTQGEDYHKVVLSYLEKIAYFIEMSGYEFKLFCDTNNLPERYIAYLCGIGHIGRNSLIYTSEYGSYVFLGEIITNAKLSVKNSYEYYKKKFDDISLFRECGICKKCLYKCPNKILFDKNFRLCVSNLTQQKKLSMYEMNKLNNMIFGCDICQDECIKNKNIKYSFIDEFDTLKFIENISDEDIVNMDNSFFKNNFKKLACSWRGKKILKRNSLIRNMNNKEFLHSLSLENNEELNNYKNLFLYNNFEE
ncbi:epoxyqueuosine reductase [Candidatus Arthromitus sp. SFB-rat-Yit]|uniref:epoxyqueuosine reductase n=1 Tax=Candidatus Arthromitus sp. SFB-rat-Yit TaxID=1041504 RepID=UPI000227A6ED|nr:QueG-associated DUF1730 domain-containing protein [Candidatus Arthromitus sp. SFB-rat-Yit]BAK81699.1 iron-sulfur cluster-binding protein [Candidatus Arthromitus sp. SFB-rat-Yit]